MGTYLSKIGSSAVTFCSNIMEIVKSGLKHLTNYEWSVKIGPSVSIFQTPDGFDVNVGFITFKARVKDQIIQISANSTQSLDDIKFMVQKKTSIEPENQCITFGERVLTSGTLAENGITNGSIVDFFHR